VNRALALLAGAALLLAAGCGGQAERSGHATTRPAKVRGATGLAGRFDGVPQSGAFLGSPRAPYTMVEFADLQCPYCARFDRDVLPTVIERFVRPGRLRLQLRPIRVIGPQSGPSGAVAVAASLQNRMWQFADLFYRNQGVENSGYVTDAFLGRIAGAVPGLDEARLRRDSPSAGVANTILENERSSRTARIYGTPNFRLGRTGGVLVEFEGRLLRRDDFVRRLRAVLAASR
jgi:protein-disulfide isomerase